MSEQKTPIEFLERIRREIPPGTTISNPDWWAERLYRWAIAAAPKPDDYIDILFDGPPSHESGRFVEVENSHRCSISFGEWLERDDGFWVLRIPNHSDRIAGLERDYVEHQKISREVIRERDRRIEELKAENRKLLHEVREWICVDCQTVYPGPPQEGFSCVQCPKCQGSTAPRSSSAYSYLLESRLTKLKKRIELVFKLNYANQPGYIPDALLGKDIPWKELHAMKAICENEGYQVPKEFKSNE